MGADDHIRVDMNRGPKMKKKIAAIILAAAAATVSVAGVGAPAYADGNGIAFGSDGTVVVLGVKGLFGHPVGVRRAG